MMNEKAGVGLDMYRRSPMLRRLVLDEVPSAVGLLFASKGDGKRYIKRREGVAHALEYEN